MTTIPRATVLFAVFAVLGAVASVTGTAAAQDTDACINASERALVLHKSAKLIDERVSLSLCSSSSCPDAVRSSCQQRLSDVSRAIPSIILAAKDGAGHDLAAVKLTIDGKVRSDHLDGSAIALDPGEHEFRFDAAGQASVVRRFVLHQNEQNRVETVVIGAAPEASPGPAAPPSASIAGSDGSTQRTIGLVVGGVGVAGLVVGGIFGALSLSAHNSYEANCGGNIGAPAGTCNSAGVSGESDAATKGTVSTIAFVAGGAAVLVGAAVFLLAPSGSAAQVGFGPGGVWMQGRF